MTGPGTRETGRTPAFERWANHSTTAVLAVTGLALLVFRHVLEPPHDDPFAVASHPLEPATLSLHVLVAPLGTLAIGLLLARHGVLRLRDPLARRGRRSGAWLLATALPMIMSGYCLQVSTSDSWRRAWLIAHAATGCAWIAGWAAHLLSGRGRGRAGVPGASRVVSSLHGPEATP